MTCGLQRVSGNICLRDHEGHVNIIIKIASIGFTCKLRALLTKGGKDNRSDLI